MATKPPETDPPEENDDENPDDETQETSGWDRLGTLISEAVNPLGERMGKIEGRLAKWEKAQGRTSSANSGSSNRSRTPATDQDTEETPQRRGFLQNLIEGKNR